MSKVRVHELAKELDINSKELIALLDGFGFPIKNHMSTLEQEELDIIFESLTQRFDKVLAIPLFAQGQKVDMPVKKAKAQSEKAEKEAEKPEEPKAKEEKKKEPEKKEEVPKEEVKKAGPSKTAPQPKKEKPKRTPPKAERPKMKTLEHVGGEDGEASTEQFERNVRHVDTRQSVVDLNKIEDEKIEELMPTNAVDDSVKKQKLKKGSGRLKDNAKMDKNVPVKEQKVKKEKKTVLIPDEISVGELAERLEVPATEVIKKLMTLGIMAAISQTIDFDVASLIAEDLGAIVEKEIILTDEDILFDDFEDDESSLEPRSPVVVVMGHVDHGKTSLLDAIRSTNVTDTEAGGITQHIGAHRVRIHDKKITFLDTPGHEAFTAMRARGAQVTDIAILVVAADDGIMPQTIEAINHAKAANLNIIVAINKIDKEAANPDKIKQELTEYDLIPEDWGGDTICVEVSAKQRINIEGLLEMVLLVAEMRELKANPNRKAKGTVIESKLDKGRGPVATVLVQNGTLRVGDTIVAGTAMGHIRAMLDDKGKRIKKAGPSVPVEILGLNEVPDGGDLFYVVEDERMAKNVIEKRKQQIKDERINAHAAVTLDDLFDRIKEGEMKELDIIVKADVQGSVEAVRQSLEKLSNDEVRVKVIHGAVGAIRESDVMLASASGAIIVGFNVRPDAGAAASAESQGVDIRLYRVIYNAIEEIEAAMKGMLEPTFKEEVTGHAEIRQTFKVSSVGTIAGCYVTDGTIHRNSQVRVVRDGIIVYEGALASLKRFKDDAKEVNSGYECGLNIENFNDIKEGDVIECFRMVEVERK
ncbi:MAG: translation initiation factor IF-2 [Clostridia bacterium]|nr:translation initiation factor IF-2 [Clostridia bacterium]MBQ3553756.1 translation initiation factor IF-2 [Clostridia bacterium]